jgi:hypothetical protein
MFESETRWFIRCDTCPDDRDPWPAVHGSFTIDKDDAAREARVDGWKIRDYPHRCPDCVREDRTERAW